MTDIDAIRRILYTDPIWSAYALADLQPEFMPYCHWSCASDPAGPGLTLLYTRLEPTALLTVGTRAAVAEALAQTPKPEQVYISVPQEHYGLIQEWYDNSRDYRPMIRMAMTRRNQTKPAPQTRARRLGDRDVDRLQALYRHGGPFTPDAFAAYELHNGVFFGVFDARGELEAVGGTHIVNPMERVAAIGNIYTRPDCRGQGHATAITQAIVAELEHLGIANIVLNVDQRNVAARNLYGRLGFTAHCEFIEGISVKRHADPRSRTVQSRSTRSNKP